MESEDNNLFYLTVLHLYILNLYIIRILPTSFLTSLAEMSFCSSTWTTPYIQFSQQMSLGTSSTTPSPQPAKLEKPCSRYKKTNQEQEQSIAYSMGDKGGNGDEPQRTHPGQAEVHR